MTTPMLANPARTPCTAPLPGPYGPGPAELYGGPRRAARPAGAVEDVGIPGPDGGSVRVLVARPAGAGPAPGVLLLHGGPHEAARDEYDPLVSLFAGIGCAVLRPNYREYLAKGVKFPFHLAGVVRSRGFPFATASIEPQSLAGGVLRVTVDQGRIDAVRVVGARNASADALLVRILATRRPVTQAAASRSSRRK